jgi:hypothetical protein
MADTSWKTKNLICNIKLLRPPPSGVVGEVALYPLRFEARPQIEHYSPHWPRTLASALDIEKVPPQQEVRRYPQLCLTKMDEGRHYSNGVGNKMYQLQPVVVQQAAEEVSRREVETVFEEETEDDMLLDVLARELFPSGGPPLNLCLRSQYPSINQRLDLGLSHRRPDPHRPRVQDASRLRLHLTARVRAGSNVAQGFDMHASEERGAERRC